MNLIQKHYRSWIIEPHQILGTCKGRKVYGDNKFMLRQLELLKEKEEYADNPEGKLSKSNIHEA